MNSTLAPSFQEEKVAEVKRRIIDAAFVCFGRYGYQGAKLTQIAELARCSRELPRYHFKSKEGLVLACLKQIGTIWINIFTEIENRKLTCAELIDHILSRTIETNARQGEQLAGMLALIFGAADPSNATLREEMLRTQMIGHRYFAKILVRYADNKELDPDINVPIMSKVLFDAFRGVTYHYMMAPESNDLEQLLGEYRKLCLKVLQPAV